MAEFQFIDIVIFAMLAVFLVLRLRSVLGKRTGNERRRSDTYTSPPVAGRKDGDNVISLPERGDREREPSDPLTAGLAAIRAADRRFDPTEFIGGARVAFEMILKAFAKGDTATLRNLLSDEVFDNFAREIERREKAGETLETDIVRMRTAEIVEAKMEGSSAMVTVKFATEQVNMLRDAENRPLPDQSTEPQDVIDLWTFARNTRSDDPTWLLIATGTAH